MPTVSDFAFLILVTVVLMAIETLVFFPRFKADALARVPGTRTRAYRRAVIGAWVCTAVAIGLWIYSARPWAALGLVAPGGVRGIASFVVVLLIGAFGVYQQRAIARLTPEKLAEFRPKLSYVEFLLPHTRQEARWFAAVSLTAGVCEELIYRGFLVWVLQPFLGTVGAMATGVALFALGHAYQGWGGVLKTGAAGTVMSILVLTTGWLIPAMILHTLIDLQSGMVGFAVLGERPTETDAVAA